MRENMLKALIDKHSAQLAKIQEELELMGAMIEDLINGLADLKREKQPKQSKSKRGE